MQIVLPVENFPISFSTVIDNNLISLFLYGDGKFDGIKNQKILMSTIRFIKDSRSLMRNPSDNLPVCYA